MKVGLLISVHSQHRGFSYIEIMVSIAILALLASTATPYLEKTIQRKKESELRFNLRQIRGALDAYKQAYDQGKMLVMVGDSGYPKQLEDLVNGVTDVTDPQKKKLKFLRRLPADPMYAGSTDNPAETWGKRSYDSDAETPREGVDVYDVYSLSEQEGLNGIPYKRW